MDGWGNIPDGFIVQLILFRDAAFNEIPWFLSPSWLLNKMEEIQALIKPSLCHRLLGQIYSTLFTYTLPIHKYMPIFKS